MDDTTYKYDVAFSFLAADEALAVELNDLLQDRLRTFLYSNRQEELAGTDGEITFGNVFGREARLVIVLYRQGWGETRWTRIEETAIRGRGFEEGYDFTLFVPLDDSRELPKWLPKTRIWFDLSRWGAAGAAAVIEQKAKEQGSTSHEEGVAERAQRLTRSIDYDQRRRAFLASAEGVNAATKEAWALSDEIEALVAQDVLRGIGIQHKRDSIYTVLLHNINLSVAFQCRFSNTLEGSQVAAVLWKGHPPFRGIMHWAEPQKIGGKAFCFDLSPAGHLQWVEGKERAFSTKDLAAYLIKYYLDKIDSSLRLAP